MTDRRAGAPRMRAILRGDKDIAAMRRQLRRERREIQEALARAPEEIEDKYLIQAMEELSHERIND